MEPNKHLLNIIQYSEYPGPRYSSQGDCSGEDFYHKRLNLAFAQAFLEDEPLIVNLDGTAGYASSFLDEAFGNLVFDFTLQNVNPRIKIISNQEPDWIEMIKSEVFSDWEQRRIKNENPKKTVIHEPWYRFIRGELKEKKWI